MKTCHLIHRSIILGALLAAACQGLAVTVTFGAGSAVITADRQATFDSLTYVNNGTSLSDYTEDSLFIGTSGDSFSGWGAAITPYFNPFHTALDPETQAFYYPFDGTTDWVTIETTDSQRMYAAEFLYGNGWTTGDITGVPWGNSDAWLEWQASRGGVVFDSGVIGPNPILSVGTIVGFWDLGGFDQLQLRCRIGTSIDPNLQALAMDNLKVQLTPVPEPATMAVLGLGALALARRRKVAKERS